MVDRIDPKPGEMLFDPACGTGGFLTCAIRHMREEVREEARKDERKMQAACARSRRSSCRTCSASPTCCCMASRIPSFVRHDNTLARPYISYGAGDRVDIVLTNPPFGGREEDGIESNFPQSFPDQGDGRPVPGADRAAAEAGRSRGRGAARRHAVRRRRQDAAQGTPDGGVQPPHHRPLPNSVFKPYASIGTNLLFFEKGEPTKDIWFYEHRCQRAEGLLDDQADPASSTCRAASTGGAARNARAVETPQAWKVTAEDMKARGYNLDIKNPHTVDGGPRRPGGAADLKERAKVGQIGLAIESIETRSHLPNGWIWAKLADLTAVLNGRAYSKNELLEVGTPVLRVGNLFTSEHWYYSNLDLEDEKYCDKGDLLFAWSASFGPFIWPGPKVIYHYHIWKLSLHSESDLDKNYLFIFLKQKTQEIKDAGHGVSMVHMTKEKMEKVLVPIPPLAEQHRIVAKVDELMTLCDQLEAQLTFSQTNSRRLLEAILRDALTSCSEEAIT
jgi:hypothetical protein